MTIGVTSRNHAEVSVTVGLFETWTGEEVHPEPFGEAMPSSWWVWSRLTGAPAACAINTATAMMTAEKSMLASSKLVVDGGFLWSSSNLCFREQLCFSVVCSLCAGREVGRKVGKGAAELMRRYQERAQELL